MKTIQFPAALPVDFTSDAPFTVYRLFDSTKRLLYVGQSSGVWVRLRDHHSTNWWKDVASVAIEPFGTRREALTAETRAILAESPAHNRRRSVDSDPVRTVRVSDDLWLRAQDTAWERRRREGVSGTVRLALRAWVADADALEAACKKILGES